jgi:hypothetical protein
MKRFLYFLITVVLLSQTALASHFIPEGYDEEAELNAAIKRSLDADLVNRNTNNAQQDKPDNTQVHFRFGNEGNHPRFEFESTGLSGLEKLHRWTDGKESTFTIPHVYGPHNARVTGVTFENVATLKPLTVLLELNNIYNGAVRIEEPSLRGSLKVLFPDNLTKPAVVKFKIPGACRPNEIDPANSDPRVLGVSLSTMFLTLEGLEGEVARPSTQALELDNDEDSEDLSSVTHLQLIEMGNIFKAIENDYKNYLLYLQGLYYGRISDILLNLESLRYNEGFKLADSEMLRRYFHICWLIEDYGIEQALVCYRKDETYCNFIKIKEKEIIAETKKRKAILEEYAKQRNIPTIQDENHVITQFLHKYQEYSFDQAKQIYRKFIFRDDKSHLDGLTNKVQALSQ